MSTGARFKKYERFVHPYSGLDPESWGRFQTNIHNFEKLSGTPDVAGAAGSLYGALENIRDIGLGLRRADDQDHIDALDEIAGNLGYEGEFIINQTALSNGIHFFPKYLNETIMDYPEDADTRDPGPVKSHGQ
jgi:hypothetical protein